MDGWVLAFQQRSPGIILILLSQSTIVPPVTVTVNGTLEEYIGLGTSVGGKLLGTAGA